MLNKIINWLRGLFSRELVHLAIVRKYTDANGYYVGELYMYGMFAGIGAYKMIGCSLDSFPLNLTSLSLSDEPLSLDVRHDFLASMADNTLRVGAMEPKDNDNVRKLIARIPRRNIRIVIQNRFIEHVLEKKKACSE
jgi:hypothetical protein